MSPARLLVLLPLLAVLAAPVTAQAEGWTAPAILPEVISEAAYAQAGVAADGTRITAANEIVSVTPVATSLAVTATRPGGAPVGELSVPSTPGGQPYLPSLAVAPDGSAVLAWLEFTTPSASAPLRFRAAYRSAGGVWEAPQTLATESVALPSEIPELVVAIRGGTAAVGFAPAEPNDPGEAVGDRVLQVAVRRADGWRPAVQVSPDDWSVGSPQVAIDGPGRVTWAARLRPNDNETPSSGDDVFNVETADVEPDGTLTGRSQLSFPGTGFSPHLAVAENGRAVIAYQHTEGGATTLRTSQRAPGSTEWSSSTPVGEGRPEGFAVDGDAITLLSTRGYDLYASRAVGSVGFTAGTRLSAPGTEIVDAPGAVAVDGGVVVVAPARAAGASGPNDRLVAMRLLRDRVNAEPQQLLDGDVDGALIAGAQADDQGSAIFVWTPRNSGGTRPRTAVLDRGGPQLDASVPTAVAGVPAALSAAASDRWSAVASGPSWLFADGTSAEGTQLTRAFAAAGPQSLSLRAVDAAGNAAERTVPFSVLPAPAGLIGAPGPSPAATVDRPACRKRERARACKSRLAKTAAWRTLRGTVTAAPTAASVELSITLRRGSTTLSYDGRRFTKPKRGAAKRWHAAKRSGGTWSLRLRALPAGSLRVTARVRAAEGGAVLATSDERRVKLR